MRSPTKAQLLALHAEEIATLKAKHAAQIIGIERSRSHLRDEPEIGVIVRGEYSGSGPWAWRQDTSDTLYFSANGSGFIARARKRKVGDGRNAVVLDVRQVA